MSNRLLQLIRLAVLLLAVGATPLAADVRLDSEIRLNDFSGIVDGAGRPIAASKLKGQVVVVDIWASWCAPCVAQLPELEALAIQTKGKGIKVVPISIDQGGAMAAVRAYARKDIRVLPLYVGPTTAIMERFGVVAIPNTLVFDPQGRLVARFRGGQKWTKESMIALAARIRSSDR